MTHFTVSVYFGYDYIHTMMDDGYWWEENDMGTAMLILKWWYENSIGNTVYLKHTVVENDNVETGQSVNLTPEVMSSCVIHNIGSKVHMIFDKYEDKYQGPQLGHYVFMEFNKH